MREVHIAQAWLYLVFILTIIEANEGLSAISYASISCFYSAKNSRVSITLRRIHDLYMQQAK
jgi:hypothetical protein